MNYLSRLMMVCVLSVGVFAVNAQAQSSLLQQFENEFVALSEDISPSVVEISVKSSKRPSRTGRMEEMFKFFGIPEPEGHPRNNDDEEPLPEPMPIAMGTGFFIDTDGYIVTNNHVVKDADEVTILMNNGTEVEAEIIGLDPDADLAVLKVDPQGLDIVPLKLGNSDNLKVGQFTIAIGSARGQTGSVSYGHISGLGREGLRLPGDELRFQHFIQTDAAINLGNSGGPLCNIKGEVIGVNVAIVYDANSIGFAIPINRVKKIAPQLIANGSVTRGWLGVSIMDIDVVAQVEDVSLEDFMEGNGLEDEAGAYVVNITSDGPSAKAGIESEDVILKVDDHKIENTLDLINYVTDLEPGTQTDVVVWRAGKSLTLDLTVGKFPGKAAATYGKDVLGMYLDELKLREEYLEKNDLDEQPTDFYVVDVLPDTPAEEANIQRGDIIIEVAHKEVTSRAEFKTLLKENAVPGKTLLMRVMQLGEEARKVYVKIPEDFSVE